MPTGCYYVRIISGEYRGRVLPARLPEGVRPTLDAARESLFNVLQHQCDWDGLHICDLFAGSGALGIEALSRGASTACFVEKNRKVVQCIQQNLDALRVSSDQVNIEQCDALEFVQNTRLRFDVLFIDPPYALHALNTILQVVLDRRLMSPHGIIVAEHGPAEHLLRDARFECLSTKIFGETTIQILRVMDEEQSKGLELV